jgi:two-component system NtrC family response regulator
LKRYREWLIQQGESDYIKQLMQESQNDINRACQISALGKSRLYALIKKYNIPRDKR